jgi:hypothetical protein
MRTLELGRRGIGTYLTGSVIVEDDGIEIIVLKEPSFLPAQDRVECVALHVSGGHDVESMNRYGEMAGFLGQRRQETSHFKV